jgi:hypothetical protein
LHIMAWRYKFAFVDIFEIYVWFFFWRVFEFIYFV